MKNLLVITDGFPQLWTNRYINNFVKEFTDLVSDQFDEVYVISPQPYFPKFLRKFDIFAKFYRCSNFKNYKYWNIKVFYPTYFTLPFKFLRNKNWEFRLNKIKSIIKKYNLKFDIIHIHFARDWLIWVKLKELYPKSKVIVHCHDSTLKKDLKVSSEKYKSIFKWVDNTISFCEHYDVINKFLKKNKIDNKNVNIPNFVNTDRFFPKENIYDLREKYWFKQDDKILICVWNLIYDHKWQDDILSIWNDLSKEIKNLHLILIWDWPDKGKMLNTIDSLDKNENIHYLWPKSNEGVVDYLNISDLFLFPSRYESFWIAPVEAISCGIPIISYKNGWTEYIINDDKVGIVLDKQDEELLKRWIIEILNKKYDRNYLHEFIVRKYSWDVVYKKLYDLYFNK